MGIARITRAIILAMALVGGFWPPARPSGVPGVRSVDVVGTAFRITLDDGRVLTQDELVGVVLLVGNDGGVTRPLRVESVLRDPADPEGDIMLYALSTPDPRTGAWQNICEADADGRRMGFPLRGSWTADGRYLSSEKGFSITCTAGAQGKCVRFGYKPWRTLPDGRLLEPYFQACTRLVRADYCGNGEGHTRDGTPIDIFDRVGIKAEEKVPGMVFEAAWEPEGAVCIRHLRIPELGSLADLVASCPRLKSIALGEACQGTVPGILFNSSYWPDQR